MAWTWPKKINKTRLLPVLRLRQPAPGPPPPPAAGIENLGHHEVCLMQARVQGTSQQNICFPEPLFTSEPVDYPGNLPETVAVDVHMEDTTASAEEMLDTTSEDEWEELEDLG